MADKPLGDVQYQCDGGSLETIMHTMKDRLRLMHTPEAAVLHTDQGGGVVEVKTFVRGQPTCIAFSIQRGSSSYVIRFRHIQGDIASCSMLCDKVKNQFRQCENASRAVPSHVGHVGVEEEGVDAWWGAAGSGELYPGSLTATREQMQRSMKLATDGHVHMAVQTDAARSLASLCATPANRQQFMECGGADTLEAMFSVGRTREIKQCAVSVLLECLNDPGLTAEYSGAVRTIGTSGSRVKQSLQELASTERGPAADPRAEACLQLLLLS
jgi:hypothetical protein